MWSYRIVKQRFLHTIAIWNVSDGRETIRLELPPDLRESPSWEFNSKRPADRFKFVFSRAGNFVAAITVQHPYEPGEPHHRGTVHVWNVRNGERVVDLAEGSPFLRCVDFSPDGNRLATGSGEGPDGRVSLWDLGSHEPLSNFRWPNNGDVLSVAFSSDGRFLFAAGGRGPGLVKRLSVTAEGKLRPIDTLLATSTMRHLEFDAKTGILLGGGRSFVNAWKLNALRRGPSP